MLRLQDSGVIRHRCSYFGREIARALGSFRNQNLQSYERVDVLVRALASAGKLFLGESLKDPGPSYYNLERFFRSACRIYPNGNWAPLIHVVADSTEYFPWELLPLFASDGPVAINDQMSLEEACRQFLGFNAIVERRAPEWAEGRSFLSAWGKLPVRFIYDARYEGALEEVGFLLSRDHVYLEGPYPRCVTDPEAPSLARQIAEPRIGVDGKARDVSDEIVHISCHCETSPGSSSSEFALHLSDEDGKCVVILLDQIRAEIMDHWRARYSATGVRDELPLVFLNACGTAVMDPAVASSFVKLFCDNKNRCVIATTANVPDRIAASVSRSFYQELFRGLEVGSALHSAKWRLLQDYRNPLGIVYCIYASAGLRMLPVVA